jgi:hypothetical protein
MNNQKFTTLLSLVALLSLSTLTRPGQAEQINQDMTSFTPRESIPNLINNAFTHNSGDYFTSTSFAGQFNLILGFDQFPENQIAQDTEILTILINDLVRQQGQPEPLRTRDLDNPYGSSLQQDPSYYIPFTP